MIGLINFHFNLKGIIIRIINLKPSIPILMAVYAERHDTQHHNVGTTCRISTSHQMQSYESETQHGSCDNDTPSVAVANLYGSWNTMTAYNQRHFHHVLQPVGHVCGNSCHESWNLDQSEQRTRFSRDKKITVVTMNMAPTSWPPSSSLVQKSVMCFTHCAHNMKRYVRWSSTPQPCLETSSSRVANTLGQAEYVSSKLHKHVMQHKHHMHHSWSSSLGYSASFNHVLLWISK